MSLGLLNNISAINAQNNLSNTQASLSKTLQQLSSGSRINSGADDAAGLSLANGLQASSTALTQSAKNASEGVDFLQVADGALSQVTSLLNRAITLATEASNGTLNSSQVTAANSEYQKILTETDTINNNTEYNGINTFAKNAAFTVSNASDKVNIGTTTTSIATVTYGSQTLKLENSGSGVGSTSGVIAHGASGVYTLASGGDTLATIAGQINSQFGASVATVQGNQLVMSGGASIAGTSTAATSTGTTFTVQNANDIINPGATGLSFKLTGAGAAVPLTGAFAAGGAGGNLAALLANIVTNGGTGGIASNVLTLTGTNQALVSTGATESGVGITSLTDTVTVSSNAATGTTSLSVGNASDLLQIGSGASNALTLTGANGTSLNLSTVANSVFVQGGAGGNLTQLSAAINSAGLAGVSSTVSGNQINIVGGSLSVNTPGALTEAEGTNTATNKTVAIFTSDGTISQSYNNAASDLVQTSSSALSLAGTDLTSTAGAQAALVAINSAITSVAASRGTIGANINTLTAVGNVMTTQSTNSLAAMNDVTATYYGQATSDMSKYQILSQTGIAALSQANQAQQLITKLLQ